MKLPDIYSYSLQSEPKKKCLKSLQSGLESCGEAVENRFGDTFTEQALKVVVEEEEKKVLLLPNSAHLQIQGWKCTVISDCRCLQWWFCEVVKV